MPTETEQRPQNSFNRQNHRLKVRGLLQEELGLWKQSRGCRLGLRRGIYLCW